MAGSNPQPVAAATGKCIGSEDPELGESPPQLSAQASSHARHPRASALSSEKASQFECQLECVSGAVGVQSDLGARAHHLFRSRNDS